MGDDSMGLLEAGQDGYHAFSDGPQPAHGKMQVDSLNLAHRTPYAHSI